MNLVIEFNKNKQLHNPEYMLEIKCVLSINEFK